MVLPFVEPQRAAAVQSIELQNVFETSMKTSIFRHRGSYADARAVADDVNVDSPSIVDCHDLNRRKSW